VWERARGSNYINPEEISDEPQNSFIAEIALLELPSHLVKYSRSLCESVFAKTFKLSSDVRKNLR
jgi:hypothetical protein